MENNNSINAKLSLFKITKRLINCSLKSTDIIGYLKEERILLDSISSLYEDSEEEIKCQAAYNHLGKNFNLIGRDILNEMRSCGKFSLEQFFSRLFESCFPASDLSLELAYRELVQGSLSIVDYKQDFKLLCGKIGIGHNNQKLKFVHGLASKEVRSILFRTDWAKYDIDGLVGFATHLVNIVGTGIGGSDYGGEMQKG